MKSDELRQRLSDAMRARALDPEFQRRAKAAQNAASCWTADRVEVLQRRWAEGASAREIAIELGDVRRRDAVIGKVHRLGLAARPSPIKRLAAS